MSCFSVFVKPSESPSTHLFRRGQNEKSVASAGTGSPAILGALRRVAEGVAEEARTRGFASLTFARFAFVRARIGSEAGDGQFGDVRKLEVV